MSSKKWPPVKPFQNAPGLRVVAVAGKRLDVENDGFDPTTG
jgi:hypothetical protein